MFDKEVILSHIKKVIKAIEPNSEIILFGSRARWEERDDSDWDVLILVPYAVGIKEERKFRHKLFNLELQFGQAISTHVKSKVEWENRVKITPLYQNILREGVRIWIILKWDEYIQYRLEKAAETFGVAELLIKNEKWNSAIKKPFTKVCLFPKNDPRRLRLYRHRNLGHSELSAVG